MAGSFYMDIAFGGQSVTGDAQVSTPSGVGTIEISSITWSVQQQGAAMSGGNLVTGVPTFNDVTVTAEVDSSFPTLASYASGGGAFDSVKLQGLRAGAANNESYIYMVVTLTGGVLSFAGLQAITKDDGTTSTLATYKFNYKEIDIQYKPSENAADKQTKILISKQSTKH